MGDFTLDQLQHIVSENFKEIKDIMEKRLLEGYKEYDSEMFLWDSDTRRTNVLEELADAAVYLISGPIKRYDEEG